MWVEMAACMWMNPQIAPLVAMSDRFAADKFSAGAHKIVLAAQRPAPVFARGLAQELGLAERFPMHFASFYWQKVIALARPTRRLIRL